MKLICIRPFGRFNTGDPVPKGDAEGFARKQHGKNVVQVADEAPTPAVTEKEPSTPEAGEKQ